MGQYECLQCFSRFSKDKSNKFQGFQEKLKIYSGFQEDMQNLKFFHDFKDF